MRIRPTWQEQNVWHCRIARVRLKDESDGIHITCEIGQLELEDEPPLVRILTEL